MQPRCRSLVFMILVTLCLCTSQAHADVRGFIKDSKAFLGDCAVQFVAAVITGDPRALITNPEIDAGKIGSAMYPAAMAAIAAINVSKLPAKRLTPLQKSVLSRYCGDLVNEVMVIYGADMLDSFSFRLPGFSKPVKITSDTAAMTFGPLIYVREKFNESSEAQHQILRHEMTHTAQWVRCGRSYPEFGYRYFAGFVHAKYSYPDIPFEREAYTNQALFHEDHGGNQATLVSMEKYTPIAVADNLKAVRLTTGNSQMEVHSLFGETLYQSHAYDGPIAIQSADASSGRWQFSFADYDRDGVDDLIGVRLLTGAQKMEVHVLSGASFYKTYLLQTSIPLDCADAAPGRWQFSTADLDRDGVPDLVGVRLRTGAQNMEVHILSGSSRFQKFISENFIPVGSADYAPGRWQFSLGDVDGDGRPDLVGVRLLTGSKYMEVHVLDGATTRPFSKFIFQKSIPLETADASPGRWQFSLTDLDRDGKPDLVGVRLTTGVKLMEVHVLSGVSNFQRFIFEHSIPLECADAARGRWQFNGRGVDAREY